MQMLDLVEKH